MKNEYYLYSIAIDVPVNNYNPELSWNIFIEKIKKISEEKNIENIITPTLIFYDLSNEAINMVFLNLVKESKPSWFVKEDRLCTKICIPVLLLYDNKNKKRIALAAFEVINNKLQDTATIIWY